MKKLLMFFVLTSLTLVIAIGFNSVKASEIGTDIFDESEIVINGQNGWLSLELLEHSIYQINFIKTDDSTAQQDFESGIGPSIFTMQAETDYGLVDEYYSGDGNAWRNFTNISLQIETGDFVDYFNLVLVGYEIEYFIHYMDIQVIWLGNTEPVDNVAPEYTYSHVSINTPYYDLVTAQEVLDQLEAYDEEDGDVTDRIRIYEDHYTSVTPKVVGDEYFIMFVVDDTAGNSAYLRVDINVIDDRKPVMENGQDSYVDGSIINFSWYNDEIGVSENPIELFNSYTSIIDEYYGEVQLDSQEAISSGWLFDFTGDWDTYNPKTPGTYNLIVTATDPSGNSISYTLNVEVLDNQAPVITGPASIDVEIVGLHIDNILAQYAASDLEDGVLLVHIDSSNTWDYLNPSLGTFTLVLRSTDSMGKSTLKNVIVNVQDTSIPVFKIDNIPTTDYNHTVYMSDKTTLQSLIDSIVVSDACYGDLTSEMVIPTFPSFNVPGVHTLTLTVTDPSGNQGTLTITVTVADDIPPVINGATKVVKGKTEILTLSDILAYLSAVDNVDGQLELELVSDGYSGNSAKIGSYLIKYKATDTSGNIKYHDVRVWVVDNSAPAWIVNDYFVNLGVNEVMSRVELVSLLQASGMIGSDISYTVTFLTDEYSGNETIEGAYNVVMNVTYSDGSEAVLQVQLNVPEFQEDSDVIIINPDPSMTGLQRFLNNTVNFFKNIWEVIKSIGLWIWDVMVWVYEKVLIPVYEFIFVKDSIDPIPPITTQTISQTSSSTTQTTQITTNLPATTTSSPIQQL